jgi:hypothetical protein
MNEKKLILVRVEQYVSPEWGQDRTQWVRYFLAPDLETVKKTVYERYGKPHYYSMDREELKYSFSEEQFETLDTRIEDRE